MSQEIVTHHGYEFIVDTMDWGNNRSTADKAGDMLKDKLSELSPAQTMFLHAALKAVADDTADNLQSACAETWSSIGMDCALAAMKADEWASIPDTGHNCDLAAH